MAHHTHIHTHTYIEKYRCIQTHAHTERYKYSFYILHFLAHLAYMPRILILYLAHHRLTHDVDTFVTLIIPFMVILVMNCSIAVKVIQFYRERKHLALQHGYTSTDGNNTQTSAHIDTHMYRDIGTPIQIHRDTCMFVHIHKYTHVCGKSEEIVTSNPLLIKNCYFKQEIWRNCYFKAILSWN